MAWHPQLFLWFWCRGWGVLQGDLQSRICALRSAVLGEVRDAGRELTLFGVTLLSCLFWKPHYIGGSVLRGEEKQRAFGE